MAIDRDEVLRIAALARLKVDPAEADALARDLERIVGYMERLKEVELPEDAESLTYFGADVHRADRAADCLDHAAALQNAPETDGDCFLVPKIVDKDGS